MTTRAPYGWTRPGRRGYPRTRQQARQQACPWCHAGIGYRCIDEDGEREPCHLERYGYVAVPPPAEERLEALILLLEDWTRQGKVRLTTADWGQIANIYDPTEWPSRVNR